MDTDTEAGLRFSRAGLVEGLQPQVFYMSQEMRFELSAGGFVRYRGRIAGPGHGNGAKNAAISGL